MTTSCLSEDSALALLLEPSGEETADARVHVADCERCREFVAALARVMLPPSRSSFGGWGADAVVLAPGTRLKHYVVGQLIGRGGMGAVYAGRDARLDREVAIKVLREEVGDRRVSWLRREAVAMAKLSHPNVAEVFDIGESDAGPFVVMELIHGMTLAEWVGGERTHSATLEAYVQAGRGLLAAHEAGIVHRDFKPSNAMVVTQGDVGRVKVLDFGLAAASGDKGGSDGDARGSTTQSALGGTPRYAAPEQFLGDPVTSASDQFSFCVALFEALAGALPFPGATGSARRTAMLRGEMRSLPGSLPAAVGRALERGLSPQATDRFPSMRALLRALEASPRRWPVALAGVGLLAVAGWALAPHEGTPCADGTERMQRAWPRPRSPEWTQRPELLRQAERLDAYVEDWLATRARVCAVQTTDARRFQAGASCLERLASALERSGTRLGTLAGTQSPLPSNLLGNLASPSRCLDERLGAAQDEPLRDEVDAYVALAKSSFDQGTLSAEQDAQIEQDGAALRLRARGLGDVRSDAQIAAVLAAQTLWHDDYGEAERRFEEAYFLARLAGDRETQFDVAENLVLLLAQHVLEPERAKYWAKEAEAAARSDVERGRVEMLHAWAAESSGRSEDALAHYDRALPLLEGDARRRDALEGRASTYLHLQRWDEGRAGLEAALALAELELGANHPELAKPVNTLMALEIMQKNFEEARVLGERALALTPEDEVLRRAGLQSNLAILFQRTGEPARALPMLEDTLEKFEAALGSAHESTVRTELLIVEVLTALGRTDEALRRVERALKNGLPDRSLSTALFARASLVDDPRPDLERILTLPGEPESTYAAAREGLAGLSSAP